MVRGGRLPSIAADYLVEGKHADAEYTRDCNYRLISFSMLLHVLLFYVFFVFLNVPLTEVSFVGTFFRFFFQIHTTSI